MPTQKPRYMLIDGNALVHRGFHAVPGLTTKTGQPTGAVFGFTSIFLRAIKDIKPTHIACTFDLAAPTFRHEQYKEYKATRVKAAPELYEQLPVVKDVVRAFHIPIFEKSGFEADDCLGTLAYTLHEKHQGKCEILIVTGDLDTLQLVNHSIKVYTLRKGITDVVIYDSEKVEERYGLTPEQMIDFKALRGDPSDNIKGVKGIGEKGAIKLIQDFGSLEKLYQAIHTNDDQGKIKEKVFQLLKNQEAEARQSYMLSKIITDVPLEVNVPEFIFSASVLKDVTQEFQKLEFTSLISKLPKVGANSKDSNHDLSEIEQAPSKTPAPIAPSTHYQTITIESQLVRLLNSISEDSLVCLSTQTTYTDPYKSLIIGLSLCFKSGTAYFLPIELINQNLAKIQALLENPKVKKLGHNLKFDLLSLNNFGIKLQAVSHDTVLQSFLLDSGIRRHTLEELAFKELGVSKQPIEELIGKGAKQITLDLVPQDKVAHFACEVADLTFRLHQTLLPQLTQQGLEEIYQKIEIPLVPVLAHMESNGIELDTRLLSEFEIEIDKELFALEKAIYHQAGEEFNVNSPKQLKEILFDKLKLPVVDNKKTKTGLSTAAAELEKMHDLHPIVPSILEYRELYKLQSTYVKALPELLNPKTRRIHTSYNQTTVATGRLSSAEPNLQNIPVKVNKHGLDIRRAFVAPSGFQLLSLDYSQIELRIVAHLSGDPTMKQVFQDGKDIHTSTAMGIFGVNENSVTKDQRRDAKTINFGILYGLSSFGLSSRITEFTRADAKDFIDKYFETYPQVRVYIETVKEEVRKNGFVRNQLGRIRRFPEIRSSIFSVRSAAERAAYNFPIQSLAADIIKIAMINIHKTLALSAQPGDCRMLLQVHDELVFEVKKDKIDHYAKIIKPLMEEALALSVPVTVEAKAGQNWSEMEKLKI